MSPVENLGVIQFLLGITIFFPEMVEVAFSGLNLGIVNMVMIEMINLVERIFDFIILGGRWGALPRQMKIIGAI